MYHGLVGLSRQICRSSTMVRVVGVVDVVDVLLLMDGQV